MITLTDEQLERLLTETRQNLVSTLLSERGDELRLMTPAQVCGLLDINQKTLDDLTDGNGNRLIPRITIVPGRVIRYLWTDVHNFLQSRRDPSGTATR